MIYSLLRVKVEDYLEWKAVYDDRQSTREQAGSQGTRVLRNVNDPNEAIVIITWPDLEHAQAFSGSSDLREAMQRSGVLGRPEVLFLEEADQTSA